MATSSAPPMAAAAPSSFGAALAWYLFVYGKKGMGKTLYAREIFQGRVRAGGRAIFIDTTGRNGDLGHVVRRAQDVIPALAAGYRALVFQPGWREKLSALWPVLAQLGHILVVADEAMNYAGSAKPDEDFLFLTQIGRNASIDLVTTAQAPTDLHPRLRQNFDVMVTFQQGTNDYAELLAKDFFQRQDLAPLLRQLPRFHYLRVTDKGEISRGVVQLPRPQSAPQLPRAA